MPDSGDQSLFERAFVATSYALDRRGEDLTSPLGAPGHETKKLALALSAPERQTRAVVLAAELARVIRAVEDRGIR
jgi:hypothetical protein